MAMRDIKNISEESDVINPTKEKRETLQLQKVHPTGTDSKANTTKVRLRSNTSLQYLGYIPKITSNKTKHSQNKYYLLYVFSNSKIELGE